MNMLSVGLISVRLTSPPYARRRQDQALLGDMPLILEPLMAGYIFIRNQRTLSIAVVFDLDKSRRIYDSINLKKTLYYLNINLTFFLGNFYNR